MALLDSVLNMINRQPKDPNAPKLQTMTRHKADKIMLDDYHTQIIRRYYVREQNCILQAIQAMVAHRKTLVLDVYSKILFFL